MDCVAIVIYKDAQSQIYLLRVFAQAIKDHEPCDKDGYDECKE